MNKCGNGKTIKSKKRVKGFATEQIINVKFVANPLMCLFIKIETACYHHTTLLFARGVENVFKVMTGTSFEDWKANMIAPNVENCFISRLTSKSHIAQDA